MSCISYLLYFHYFLHIAVKIIAEKKDNTINRSTNRKTKNSIILIAYM